MPIPRKVSPRYDEMSREQLVARLRDLDARSDPSGDEIPALIHDLEVHQIELEVQNRELREAQALLESARDRLSDLYDFAPVVYLGLDADTTITEANLTAAAMFGTERGKLIGKRLTAL